MQFNAYMLSQFLKKAKHHSNSNTSKNSSNAEQS